jgi:hypothetical protein
MCFCHHPIWVRDTLSVLVLVVLLIGLIVENTNSGQSGPEIHKEEQWHTMHRSYMD